MAGILPRGRPDTSLQKQRFRLQQLVQNADTDEDLLEVWDHVKEQAKSSGDIQWAVLYLAYRLGKPASMDPTQAGIQVDGNLNIAISQLSRDQLRALASIDASYTTLEPEPVALPTPSND